MADKDDTKQPDKAAAEKPKRTPAKPKAAKGEGAKAKSSGTKAKAEGSKPRAASRKKADDATAETKAPRKRTAAKKPAAAKAETETKPDAEAKDAKEAAKPPARRRAPRSGGTAARRRGAAAKPQAERPAAQRPVVRAKAKYVHSSARKARLVMEHVRGKSVDDARALLQHHPRGVARDVQRLLESAIANAENNHDLVGDDLYVKEIYADEGPTLKRYRPRAQGRVYRVRKRTSHLSVALSTKS